MGDVELIKNRLSALRDYFPIPESRLDVRSSCSSTSEQQSCLVSQTLRQQLWQGVAPSSLVV